MATLDGLYLGGTASPTITIDSSNGTAGLMILKDDVTVDSTLTSGTAQILSGGSNTNRGAVDLFGATRTFTVNNGTAATDLLVSASLQNGGVTKAGAGTMTVTGASTFTGATTVNAGTLEAGAAGALAATTAITVNNTGTLLLSGTGDRVNNSAGLTLNGGTLNTGGLSETMGALTLSADSTIDFGAGNASELTFTTLTLGGNNLNIWNWTTTNGYIPDGGTAGDGLRDRLLFTTLGTLSATELSEIHFFSGAGTGALGDGVQISFGGNQELVPVPEPTTIFGALALVGLVGYRERRRFRRTAKGATAV